MLAELHTVKLRHEDDVSYLQIYRPDSNNTINDQLVIDLSNALSECSKTAKIVVLEGLAEVFCFGADFSEIEKKSSSTDSKSYSDPAPLYDLWLAIAQSSFITVAHVRGKTNAGGIGFVAACDLVVAESKATFSLSELLFGLLPACVMPFLIRKVGFSNANSFTVSTQTISAKQALMIGLVDAVEDDSKNLLRKYLLRLRRLDKKGIARYKDYMSQLDTSLVSSRSGAIDANNVVFSDPSNLAKITRYVTTGKFPWE